MTEKIVDFPSNTSTDPRDVSICQNSTFSRTTSTQTNNKDICNGTTYMHGSRIFLSGGGGGGPGSSTYFTVYRGCSMVLLHIFQGGGVQLFFRGGGVQLPISIETYITITCDFPGGSGTHIPPLDPHILARIGSDEPVRPPFRA